MRSGSTRWSLCQCCTKSGSRSPRYRISWHNWLGALPPRPRTIQCAQSAHRRHNKRPNEDKNHAQCDPIVICAAIIIEARFAAIHALVARLPITVLLVLAMYTASSWSSKLIPTVGATRLAGGARVWTRTRGTARHRLATRMASVAVAEFSRRTRCACRGVTNHGQLVAASPLAWFACRTVVLVSVSFRANHAIWACCRKCVAFNSECRLLSVSREVMREPGQLVVRQIDYSRIV